MPVDLMTALGAPEDESEETPTTVDNPKPKGGSSLLDKEDPAVVADLMDAVDDTLDATTRAESLCRAMKAYVAGGGGMVDADDSEMLGAEY